MSAEVDNFNLITVKRSVFIKDFPNDMNDMNDMDNFDNYDIQDEDSFMKELNIIAVCKLSKSKIVEKYNQNKDFSWNSFSLESCKNIDDINNINNNKEKLKKDKRNEGFYILANKDNVSKHLRKTKFCNILIKKGKCDRDTCYFAHTLSEFHFPECAFKDNCKKIDTCEFKHPNETLEEYKQRTGFIVPKNIK